MCRPIGRLGAAFAIVLSLAASGWAAVPRPRQDKALTDAEFWHLVTSLSEEGGRFPQQLMSNEDSLQFVVPELARTVRPGGVYLGVGSEQNFTYFATLRPTLAFVVDIRRDNLLEMLMYQALFESSSDRADFISRLFSRPRPVRFKPNSTAAELFAAFANQQPDQALTELTANAVIDRLLHRHGFALPEADQAGIRRMLDQFRLYGPGGLKGYGDRTNPTFVELMSAGDLQGRPHGFLESSASYDLVRAIESENRVVPVVGDFDGTGALNGIAQYLQSHHERVSVFYVSNVERYLWEQVDHGKQFYANVRALPLVPSAVFIRSVTRDISTRVGIPLPDRATHWWSFVSSIQGCLTNLAAGKITSYRELFTTSH